MMRRMSRDEWQASVEAARFCSTLRCGALASNAFVLTALRVNIFFVLIGFFLMSFGWELGGNWMRYIVVQNKLQLTMIYLGSRLWQLVNRILWDQRWSSIQTTLVIFWKRHVVYIQYIYIYMLAPSLRSTFDTGDVHGQTQCALQ